MKRALRLSLEYFRRLNKVLVLLCLVSCAFSVVLLYTMVQNNVSDYVKPRHYEMQFYMTLLGLLLALVLAGINYRSLAKVWFLYAPLALILTLLLFSPLGITVDGADDIGWLYLGFMTIQPSEFLKIAFIMTFSSHLAKLGPERMNYLPNLILLMIHGLAPALLIMVTGDDGTALVFGVMMLIMLFVAGLWWRYIIAALALSPALVYLAWNYFMKPHQIMRFKILLDQTVQQEQMQGLYYQQFHSLLALGSGGMQGVGLHADSYVYVSVIQSDFIFAYIGMALGFIGCAATVALLLFICTRILHVAFVARDPLGKYICVGVFAMFLVHSIVNIGMVLAVFPVVGVPLPFISAGGSSLLATFLAVGLVLSVYAHKDKKKHMFYDEQ